jgi:hypothetical protein
VERIINASGLPDAAIEHEVGRLQSQIGRELGRWVDDMRAASRRSSIFDRAGYAAPDNVYSQMHIARRAVETDDIVSGVADVTEALALQGIQWESSNPDITDVFNQISQRLNLDQVMRTWHREEFTYSQAIIGVWWDQQQFTVRGETKAGVKRRKTYDLYCPTGITFLDPLKVVPVGTTIFGADRLAWQATDGEIKAVEAMASGALIDPVMSRFFLAPYIPDRSEAERLADLGVDPRRLIELNPVNVFRHTATKPDYQRFADVRLKSAFALLDLKQQLMEADRVNLVGAANYILLVRKGTKDDPASQEEVDNLQDNFKVVAKIPVIISDHRLEIDIITPAQDYVLNADKYDTLDRRILGRCLGALTVASSGQRNETSLTVARGVARMLESRRHMMKRTMEDRIARAIVKHPQNADQFQGDEEPNMAFTPRNVQLDADSQVVQAVMALRTQKELSRESILEYFGFDQSVEAQRREYEEESGLDDTFGTVVPFSAQGADTPNGAPKASSVSGAEGGRPSGGGETKQSPQAQTKPRTARGNTSTKKG